MARMAQQLDNRSHPLLGAACQIVWGCLGMGSLALVLASAYQIPMPGILAVLFGVVFHIGFMLVFQRKTWIPGVVVLAGGLLLATVTVSGFWSSLPRCFSVLAATIFQRFDQTGMIVLVTFDYRSILISMRTAQVEAGRAGLPVGGFRRAVCLGGAFPPSPAAAYPLLRGPPIPLLDLRFRAFAWRVPHSDLFFDQRIRHAARHTR